MTDNQPDISLHKNGLDIQPNDDGPKKPKRKGNFIVYYLKMVWEWRKIITVEPAVACWIVPSLLMMIAIQNLQLEKSCRVNLGLDDVICTNMIDRSINNIECAPLDELTAQTNSSTNLFNISDALFRADRTLTDAELIHELKVKVCEAETESLKVIAFINGYRTPIAQIFSIIIILFAGGWSDKKGIRKPCILFPIIGELVGCIALFISAIFMLQIPLEFGAVLEKMLSAMFGGQTLMFIGIYSYLSAVTTEENRVSRFGGFAAFFMILQIVSLPFSGDLFNVLGYTKMFLLCIIIYCVGIVYTLFVLKEVKIKQSDENETGKENAAFEGELNAEPEQFVNQNSEPSQMKAIQISDPLATTLQVKKNYLREFFDPKLVISCAKVFIKHRENNGRKVLFILAGVHFLYSCPVFGEQDDYHFGFTRSVLNWSNSTYSYYSTYAAVIVLIGTSLMTGLFTKLFKITDPMIAVASITLSIVAKPIFAFSKTSFLYFAAMTVDCFIATKQIAMKSIIARFVAAEELGRIFSILGIVEAIVTFFMPPIYSFVYYKTVDNFIGAFYLFGEIFMIPALVGLIYVYIILKTAPPEAVTSKSPEDGLQVPATTNHHHKN